MFGFREPWAIRSLPVLAFSSDQDLLICNHQSQIFAFHFVLSDLQYLDMYMYVYNAYC